MLLRLERLSHVNLDLSSRVKVLLHHDGQLLSLSFNQVAMGEREVLCQILHLDLLQLLLPLFLGSFLILETLVGTRYLLP